MVKEEPENPTVDVGAWLALVLIRYLMGWEQADLAREARIAQSQVSVYDRGKRTVPPEVLRRAADAADFPPYLLEPVKRSIRSFRAAAKGRPRAERALGDAFVAELLVLGRLATDTILGKLTPEETTARPPSSEDREEAADLWTRMERRTLKQRRALVEETEEFRCWALCERVAAASLEAAAVNPIQAKELAELALLIADLAPGKESWRNRLRGYAMAHHANVLKAAGELKAAAGALEEAKRLWHSGADPAGLLNQGLSFDV
jgi:transcriptional regulator with XRE-family HTH domain